MKALAINRVVLVSTLALGAAACSDGGSADGGSAPGAGAGSAVVLAPGARGPAVQAAHAYFEQFGYFENAELAARFPDWRPILGRAQDAADVYGEDMRLAVDFFQSRSGLPVTGVIDAATQAAMAEPRCGNPDSYTADVEDKWSKDGFTIIPDNPVTYAVQNVPSRLGEFTNSADILTYIQISLDRWAARTNLTFVRDDNAYDFLIRFADIPCTAPCNQVLGRTTQSPLTITLNTSVNFDKSNSTAGVDFISTLAHETGHALGLGHSSVTTLLAQDYPLMYKSLANGVTRDSLRVDDMQAVAALPYTSWADETGASLTVRDIGASYIGNDNETAWRIAGNATSEGFQVFRWRNLTDDWQQINGGGVRIDLAGLVPYVVTSGGLVKSKASVTEANPNGNGWNSRGNLAFIDVGVNSAEVVWALGGTRNSAGNYPVYRNTGGSNWTLVDGAGFRIDVAPDGTPWITTAGGSVFRRLGVTSTNPNGTSWTQVGAPPAQDIAVGRDGAVWMTDKLNGIYELHQQPAIDNSNPQNGRTTDREDTPAIDTWEQVDGEGSSISVGMRSLPWVTGTDLSLWRRYGG
jgi:hypothetical protein